MLPQRRSAASSASLPPLAAFKDHSAEAALAVVLAGSLWALGTTTWTLLSPGSAPSGTGLQLTAATLACLVVPGLLLVLSWPRDLDLDLIEIVAAGFALNLIAVMALCVLTLELHLGVTFAAGALLVAGWLLFGWLMFFWRRAGWPIRSADLRCSSALLVLLLAVIAAACVAYRIGGLDAQQQLDLFDGAEQVAIVQKIAHLPSLSPNGIMYLPDAASSYYYPTYFFGLGMVSRVAGLAPLVVYGKWRGVATVLAIAAFYTAGRTLVRDRRVARLLLAAGMAMVFSGQAARTGRQDYSWGVLTPIAHEADFGLEICLLLEVIFVVRFLRSGSSDRLFAVATPLLVLTVATIHTREVAHILSYLVLLPVLLLAFRPPEWRPVLWRTLAAAAGILVIAKGYQTMVTLRVPHIAAYTAVTAADQRLQFRLQGLGDLFANGNIDEIVGAFSPLLLLAVLAVPALLLGFPRKLGVLFICGGILFWTTITSFSALERLLALSSYSQILFTGSGYMFHFGLWIAGLLVALTAWALNQLWRSRGSGPRSVAIPFVATLAAPFVFWFLYAVRGFANGRFLWLFAIAGAVFVTIWLSDQHALGRPFRGWAFSELTRWQRGGALLALPALVGLYFFSPTQSLLAQFAAARQHADLSSFDDWYAASSVSKLLPAPIRDALASQPPGGVVAAEGGDNMAISMFTPQYVLSSGSISPNAAFSTDFQFLDQWAALQPSPPDYDANIDWAGYARELSFKPGDAIARDIQVSEELKARTAEGGKVLSEIRPIFSDQEANDLTLRYLAAWHVDYLVLDPTHHQRLKRLADSRPDVFSPLAETPLRDLYRVRGRS